MARAPRTGERELRPARVSQSGGTRPSTTPCASSRPTTPAVALHRVEVARRVPARQRQPGDEVVEDEVVQDDDARPPAERVDDPAVRLRVVPDVVERDVRPARTGRAGGGDDLDLDAPLERGQEERAVVGDAGALGRQRRVVRDLHAEQRGRSSRPTSRSPATALPARPQRAGLVHVLAQPGERVGDRGRASARTTSPVSRSRDDLERAARVGRRHDRLLREERLVRDDPEVLVDRRVVRRRGSARTARRAPRRRRGRRT